jgi:S-adenosylmethionine:tRNA ribosyltransferase-isomerase
VSSPIDPTLRTSDFDYHLPPELIAQKPLERREASRLLVLHRDTGTIEHSRVTRVGEFLNLGDVIVANNSRVILARLHARRSGTGGKVELLLLRKHDDGRWEALAKPARRLKVAETLLVGPVADQPALEDGVAIVEEKSPNGLVRVRLDELVEDRLDLYGVTPLPPYITQSLSDADRYQTVYARESGSAAAPTAGLHFSKDLIESLRQHGIGWAEVTLHIGLDTFRPVTVDRIADHAMHSEWCHIDDGTAERITEAREPGHRVVALGTSAARTLETAGQRWENGAPSSFSTDTKIFITPGYRWRLVDAMITNFHLPRSTLLMMVSAFAGRDLILRAYNEAIERRYRFYSFGDAMLIL